MKERNGYKEKKEGILVTWFGCLLRNTETIFIKTWKYPASDTILSYWLKHLQLPTGAFQ
jgi:myosin-crossreactive antigen